MDWLGEGTAAGSGACRSSPRLGVFQCWSVSAQCYRGKLRSKQGGRETSLVGRGAVLPDPALAGVDFPRGASEPV